MWSPPRRSKMPRPRVARNRDLIAVIHLDAKISARALARAGQRPTRPCSRRSLVSDAALDGGGTDHEIWRVVADIDHPDHAHAHPAIMSGLGGADYRDYRPSLPPRKGEGRAGAANVKAARPAISGGVPRL